MDMLIWLFGKVHSDFLMAHLQNFFSYQKKGIFTLVLNLQLTFRVSSKWPIFNLDHRSRPFCVTFLINRKNLEQD